ncbi:hypothetical protein BKA70DRAFT_1216199 [Coprinopsis sp. MPI-PUGE-AT-0042]|nr:hypothetical protein BKA70DRAFT_1216199 [Coprinopsis sp. MPI-PUGE-AT-0042]
MPLQISPDVRVISVPRKPVRYKPILKTIKSLLFSTSNASPATVSVPTLVNPSGRQRFPCIEAVMGARSRIHDCTVEVLDGMGRPCQFLVSCQADDLLPMNRSLRVLAPGLQWTGSILVMKIGQQAAFISLSSADKPVAIVALQRFIEACWNREQGDNSLPPYIPL